MEEMVRIKIKAPLAWALNRLREKYDPKNLIDKNDFVIFATSIKLRNELDALCEQYMMLRNVRKQN